MHGYLRLKNDPRIDQLTQHVLKGRIAEHWLKLLEIIPDDKINKDQIDNEFLDLNELQEMNLIGGYNESLSNDEIETEKEKIKKVKSHIRLL